MLVAIFIMVTVLAGLAGVSRLMFVQAVVRGEVGPTIYDRVDLVLAPHQGGRLDDETMASLEDRAERAFEDALLDLRLDKGGWRIRLMPDEVMSCICVVKHLDGRELSLPDFERKLRAHEIRLDRA